MAPSLRSERTRPLPFLYAFPTFLVLLFCSILLYPSIPGPGAEEPENGLPGSALAGTISFQNLPVTVGSGLISNFLWVELSDRFHGGVTVRVESANPGLALVSSSAGVPGTPYFETFVPDGQVDFAFYVHGLEDTTGSAAIVASAPGFTAGIDTAFVVRPAIELGGLNSSLDVLQSDDLFFVTLGVPKSSGESLSDIQRVRPGGDVIQITAANLENAVGELVTPTVVDQTVSVEIEVGEASTAASPGTLAFRPSAPGSTFVAATSPVCFSTARATQRVYVTNPSLSLSGVNSTVLGAGLQLGGPAVQLSGPQHGGVTVHIESGDSTVLLVSPDDSTAGTSSIDVFIPDGSTTRSFWIQGMEGSFGITTVTASAPGFGQDQGGVLVLTGRIDITGLPASVDLLDPPESFLVRVGSPAGGPSVSPQSVRAGGPPLDVTVSTSQLPVGSLRSPPDSGAVVTATIAPGDYESNEIEFFPASAGTTTIDVTAPGFDTAPDGVRELEVTQSGISLASLPGELPAGCQTYGVSAALSTANHGGVSVHIESSDSTLCLVASDDSTLGTSAIDVFVPDGSQNADFVLQGLEGVLGAAAITASAPGFVGSVDSVTVVQGAIGFDLFFWSTIETGDRPRGIRVLFGTPNSAGTYLSQTFRLRAGGPGLPITVSSSVGSVGSLESSADSGSVVVVSPGPLAFRTELFDFIPVAPGTTIVTATAPDFITTTTQGEKQVTVTQSSAYIVLSSPTPAILRGKIGSGLQRGGNKVVLSAFGHGGVDVHVESGDSSVCLVSPDDTTLGARAIDLFIPDGKFEASFYIQGLEGVTGTVPIFASVPGFTGDVDSVTIVQPAVRLSPTLVDEVSLSSPPGSFVAWTGIPIQPSPDASYLIVQSVRAGGTPLTVTATSSDSLTGILWAPADSGATVTASVAASELASDTLKFVPVAPGTTVVTVSIPGFLTIKPGSQEIRVTELSVSLSNFPARVGSGLQQEDLRAVLSNYDHSGITIHIESEDSTLFLISPDPLTPGVPAVDVFLESGKSVAQFIVHGLEGMTGEARVFASIPGPAADTGLVEVVQPGLDLSGLGLGTDLNNPTDQFTVRTGVPNASGTGLSRTQALRVGATDLTVTVTHTDTAAAELVSLSLTGQTVTTSIASGFDQSPDSVALGGVGFSPVAPGTTYVSASAPGFLTTAAGSQRVFVIDMLTAVSVESHAAYWSKDHVVVEWRLSEGSEETWFEVYRLEGLGELENGIPLPLEAFTRLRSSEIARDGNHFTLRDPDVERGRSYVYRVLVYETDGSTASFESTVRIPGLELVLYPNKPNPFNPTTRIAFELPSAEVVNLRVYDLQGRLVRTLLEGFTPSGLREVIWDGTNDRGQAVGSGVYFYRLKAGKESVMRKMVLLK